jgi:hypothetical protein
MEKFHIWDPGSGFFVGDPDLGSGAFLTPGIWDPESVINILFHISKSFLSIFGLKIL